MSSRAVPFGTRSFPSPTRHFRAGLLECSVPTGLVALFDRLRRPWAPRLFNLNGEIELAKKLIWTSMLVITPCCYGFNEPGVWQRSV